MLDDVHIEHLIVIYTPHAPTHTDDQINEHIVLNDSDNENEIVTANNTSNDTNESATKKTVMKL